MASGRTVRVECEGVSVFLLMVLVALHHTVKAEVKKLDMAPDAVDDDFSQCRDKMLKAVTEPDGLLQKELSADKEFEELWNEYSQDSLRLLSRTKTCKTVFYATRNMYTADTADIGTEVRFGKFLRATLSSEIEDLHSNSGTLFNITSCSVVNVEENTCVSEELQCFISPAEVFTVQNVRDLTMDDATYKEITLTHSRFLHNHDCSFFHRNAADVDSSISLTFTLLALTASLLPQFTVMA
ncbi:hypothetical protein PGIGA_G00261170 [Pangasianodon gigas]|nr:hypothetical protein [Pangasianodon gigas]